MKKLVAGVIGCGNISQHHFSGLEKYGAQIKWVCDLSENAALPWADKYNAKFTPDYREIISDPDVDTVLVTLVSRLHKEICIAAIKTGKAVICEKTLAENADDAWDIIKLAEEQKTIFYTSYMKRFIPAVEKAKELLPQLGRIISSYARTCQSWGKWDGNPAAGLLHTPPGGTSMIRKKYGGGILVCGGSHILDLILFLLGRPVRLYGSVYVPDDRDYDLQASAILETPNGVVHFEALAHSLRKIGFLRDGWDERLEINGQNGRLEIFSSNWSEVKTKSSLLIYYDNSAGNVTEYRFDPVSPFDRAIEFYCSQIEKGKQGTQSKLTGYEVDELIESIKRSSESKQPVEIQWKSF